MKVGLTGATGVLGSRLATAFGSHGHEIVPFRGDVRDPASVQDWAHGLPVLVHSAAMVPVQQVEKRIDEAIAINVGGTANVARAAAINSARLIYISTSHVYRSSTCRLSEDDPLDPVSLYGMTKLQGEQWVGKLTANNLILRLFSYFDRHQAESYLVPSLCRRIAEAPLGSSIDLFGGENRRDMSDAAWLSETCARLAISDAQGVVNCATGRDDRVIDIAQMLAEEMGRADLSWNIVQDRPADSLLADTSRLAALLPSQAPFALRASLRSYAERSRTQHLATRDTELQP
ncbi:NAD-dependent epimerase/dehydratase family protein [Sphingomonas tabacisoli]|uniref:dTDP-4-dehydrorhamnose reductase n=1 Tax=Sphingomonas tabacisoli TaxID=2249466 RepID=A0ABW4I5N8_9SPHN